MSSEYSSMGNTEKPPNSTSSPSTTFSLPLSGFWITLVCSYPSSTFSLPLSSPSLPLRGVIWHRTKQTRIALAMEMNFEDIRNFFIFGGPFNVWINLASNVSRLTSSFKAIYCQGGNIVPDFTSLTPAISGFAPSPLRTNGTHRLL